MELTPKQYLVLGTPIYKGRVEDKILVGVKSTGKVFLLRSQARMYTTEKFRRGVMNSVQWCAYSGCNESSTADTPAAAMLLDCDVCDQPFCKYHRDLAIRLSDGGYGRYEGSSDTTDPNVVALCVDHTLAD
jgi:hypothetical protein